MSATPHVLLLGRDEMLNITRRLILERAGFAVFVAHDSSEVGTLLSEHRVDLVTLCGNLTEEDCLRAIALVEAANPDVAKIWIGRHSSSTFAALPKTTVLSADGPHELYLAAMQLSQHIAGSCQAS